MAFSKNVLWIIITSIIVLILLILIVPKNRIREAWLNFVFFQTLTWATGVILAEYNLVKSPFRMFPKATTQNFFNDFIIFPSISVLYYFLFPYQQKRYIQCLFILGSAIVVGIYDFSVERFTDLKRYIHWSAFNQFLLAIIFNYGSLWFTLWFFKKLKNRKKVRL